MPILGWLQYADPRLAPYGRSSTALGQELEITVHERRLVIDAV
jgi:hypothetical protein